MKSALLTVLLVACSKQGASERVAPIELPEVFSAKQLDEQDRITIDLTANGVVRVEGRQVSLDELSEELSKQKRTRGFHEAWNIYGTERRSVGEASDLYVLLRADRRAPWQHVTFLFTVLMEEKIERLQFAVEGGRLDAFLRVDIAIEWIEGQEPKETLINVDVLSSDPWKYRVGATETSDVGKALAAAKTMLKNARESVRGKDVGMVGQVRAANTAQLGAVADLYARMRTCAFTRVQFYGTVIPSRGVRELRSLPRPNDTGLVPWEDHFPWEDHWNEDEGD